MNRLLCLLVFFFLLLPTLGWGQKATGPASDPKTIVLPLPALSTSTPEKDKRTRLGDDAKREAIELQIGAIMMGRYSKVNQSNSGSTVLCFCSSPESPYNFVFGGTLNAEIFPFAFAQQVNWYDHLGLYGDFTIALFTSATELDYVILGRGGLTYRWVWWDSVHAPSLEFRAGYRHEDAPLNSAYLFPGLTFGSIEAGLLWNLPLGGRAFSFQAEGNALALVFADSTFYLGTLDNFLGRRWGYSARAAFKMDFAGFEIIAHGNLQGYSIGFSGQTTLGNYAFNGLHINDRLLWAGLSIGGSF